MSWRNSATPASAEPAKIEYKRIPFFLKIVKMIKIEKNQENKRQTEVDTECLGNQKAKNSYQNSLDDKKAAI